ncbi:MAG: (2Fe-2S)-binding protein [Cryobacterium sp.]|nr:(2Fe-2S)-binding protein [Cryobacterium sp.]
MSVKPYPGWEKISWPEKKNHIPKEVFVRPDVFEEELKRLFYGKEWLAVGHEAEIPNPGDFKTFMMARVPLLITRDMNGEVNVVYNACSHRGNQLETESRGNKIEFECPYHRWVFDPNGDLIGCPAKASEFSPGFKKSDYPLDRPRFAISNGIIFVTFNLDTPELSEHLGKQVEDHTAMVLGGGKLKLIGYHKIIFKANWKAYADNDSYHAPLLHTAFRMLSWGGGKGSRFANEKGQRGFISELSLPRDTGMLKDPSLIEYRSGDLSKGSTAVHMFPMFSIVHHLDVINLRFATPLSADQTEAHYAYFCREDDDAEMVRHRVRQSSNLIGPCGMISMEDAAVFQRLHIGGFTPGSAIFQKGVKDEYALPTDFSQNDEAANLLWWEHYRNAMEFGGSNK